MPALLIFSSRKATKNPKTLILIKELPHDSKQASLKSRKRKKIEIPPRNVIIIELTPSQNSSIKHTLTETFI